MLESNFHRDLAGPRLRALAARGNATFVHCVAPVDVIRARHAARVRHSGHQDGERLAAWDGDVAVFEPPDGIRRIRVDTTGAPDVAATAARIRRPA